MTLAMERAHVRVFADDVDGAIPHLHRASKIDPSNPDPVRDLALIRMNRQYEAMPLPLKLQYQRLALEGFEKVISIHPFDWRVCIQAAECEMSLAWGGGDVPEVEARWERALGHCERALEIAPTKWEVHDTVARYKLNYAYYLAEVGRLTEAYRMAGAALDAFLEVPK